MLILSSVETGQLIGYLEWAEPIMQDSGAGFYLMKVCTYPSPSAVTFGMTY